MTEKQHICFRCKICDAFCRLHFKEQRVDVLYKEYLCENGHKTIVRRYGTTIEVCDEKNNKYTTKTR